MSCVAWKSVQAVQVSSRVVESVIPAISSYLSINCSPNPSDVCQPMSAKARGMLAMKPVREGWEVKGNQVR